MALAASDQTPAIAATVPFVDLRRQHGELGGDLRAAFDATLEGVDCLLSEQIEAFEAEFAAFCGAGQCAGVSSGTAALKLALLGAGIGPGDEVILPAHAGVGSALAVLHTGATLALCDVRADTGLIDARSAAELVGDRTAAVVAVHLYGQACDMHEIAALADRYGLLVAEDASRCHGATFEGRRVGALGDVAAFSFHPSANLGGLGSAGAVCTSDVTIAERVRRLRGFGGGVEGFGAELGFDEPLDGAQAAFLRVKLGRLEASNVVRRAWAAMYRAVLPTAVTTLWEDDRGTCVFSAFPIRVPNRDAVLEGLRSRGVDARAQHWPGLHEQPALAGHRLSGIGVGAAQEWSEEELLLPIFPELTADEVGRVAEALAEVLEDEAA